MARKKKKPQVQTRPITREDAEAVTDSYIENITGGTHFGEAFSLRKPDIISGWDHLNGAEYDRAISHICGTLDQIEERMLATIRPALAEAFYHEGNRILGYPIDDAVGAEAPLQSALEALLDARAAGRDGSFATATLARLLNMLALATSSAIGKHLRFAGLLGDDAHYVVRGDYAPLQRCGLLKGASLWVRPMEASPGQRVLVSVGPDILIAGELVSQADTRHFTIKVGSNDLELLELEDGSALIEGVIVSWEANGTVVDTDLVTDATGAADRAASAISSTVAPQRPPARKRSAGSKPAQTA